MDMEFVVIDDEEDSSSEFNYGKANSGNGNNRGLIDKLRDSLGFNDEELVITSNGNGNSLSRRNVNSNRENEVQSPRSRVRLGSSESAWSVRKPNLRSDDQQDHDHERHGKQAVSGTKIDLQLSSHSH